MTHYWMQVMYAKYEANLNIDGTGAIVAAPDLETPGEKKTSFVNYCEIGGFTTSAKVNNRNIE